MCSAGFTAEGLWSCKLVQHQAQMNPAGYWSLQELIYNRVIFAHWTAACLFLIAGLAHLVRGLRAKLVFLSVHHHHIMPWVLSVQLPCLHGGCGHVIDWHSANNSPDDRTRNSLGIIFLQQGWLCAASRSVEKPDYNNIYKLILVTETSWGGCESLTPFLRQPIMAFLNIVVFFCSENNRRSTVPLQTKPEHALTYMRNIKERLFRTHYHPSVLQQTPRHGRETLGKLYIVYSAECHPCNYPVALAPRCCG